MGSSRAPGVGATAGSRPSVWPRWSAARADASATLVDISGPDLPCARSQTRPCSHGAPRPTSAPHPRGGLLQLLSLQTLPSRDAFSSPLRNSALSQNLATSVLSSPRPSHHRFLPERPRGDLLPNPLLLPFSPIRVVLKPQSPCTNKLGPRSPRNPAVASLSLRRPQASRGLHGAA